MVVFGFILSSSYAQHNNNNSCRFGNSCLSNSDEAPLQVIASTTSNTDNTRPTRYTSKAVTAGTYIVQPGDSLAKIASNFSLTVAELAKANSITNYNNLFVGQVLNIPSE